MRFLSYAAEKFCYAPEAVKNVVAPVQNTKMPMIHVETISALTWYCRMMTGNPGAIIGPKLDVRQYLRLRDKAEKAYDVVTPELNARMSMIEFFHTGDLICVSTDERTIVTSRSMHTNSADHSGCRLAEAGE
jgi:hypothetical protein